MPNDFLNQFMAGWQMGQGRNESQRRDLELQQQQEQEMYRRQQEMEDRALRQQQLKLQEEEIRQQRKRAQFEDALKERELRESAARLPTGDITAAEAGIQQMTPQDVGPSLAEINVPRPTQMVPSLTGGQDISVPILTGREQEAQAQAEQQRKIREALGMLQAQEGIKAQFRAPERPVAVSPGSTLVDPSTGKPIYTAPKPVLEPGEMSAKQTQNYLTITNKFQADPIMSAAGNARQASLLADEAIRDPANVTNQLTTLYLLVKNLDPTSAVREGELGLAQSTQSYWQKFQSSWARVSSGQIIAPAAAKELAEATKRVVKLWEDRGTARINQYRSQAKGAGIGSAFEEYLTGAGIGTPAGGGPAGGDEGWQTVAGVRVRKKVR